MNKMRKETKIGILGLAIYTAFKFAGTYIEEITTSNILNYAMGMCR